MSGVKSVTVDFGAEIISEFSFRQMPTSLRSLNPWILEDAGANDSRAGLETSEDSCSLSPSYLSYQDSHRVMAGGKDDPAILDISVP